MRASLTSPTVIAMLETLVPRRVECLFSIATTVPLSTPPVAVDLPWCHLLHHPLPTAVLPLRRRQVVQVAHHLLPLASLRTASASVLLLRLLIILLMLLLLSTTWTHKPPKIQAKKEVIYVEPKGEETLRKMKLMSFLRLNLARSGGNPQKILII